MVQSMTAFARTEHTADWGRLVCEIRTLNHRYLEIALRLPEELRSLEGAVRKQIGSHLKRGKVDLTIRLKREQGSASELTLNQDLAGQLANLHRELEHRISAARSADLGVLMNWPGLISEGEVDFRPISSAAGELVNNCLAAVSEARQREGDELKSLVESRLDQIDIHTEQVRGWLPDIRLALAERLRGKVEEICKSVDAERIEQEIAILAQKADVDEELDRLRTHLGEMRRVLQTDEPIGRRLDFLTQELHREANTLGAKSVDKRTSGIGVDLKVLIEQIREQVQNIE